MADLGLPELLIIVVVFVLLFGSAKLPDAARSVGRSLRVLKTEVNRPDDVPPPSGEGGSGEPGGPPPPPGENGGPGDGGRPPAARS
ncbi:twin-arginine translocase TatA/TatE family subunit [Streptosporangium sp. NPDC002721]|uniref:twin-arginine translocase TatA/TatE family subunit n=1 Tax=Streptosporangium sp. NPDC002721 TaxID=3366188 RepID=UPI0036BA6583